MTNVNVVCVNWGSKYSPDYVYRLHNMISRHTKYNFKMYCLTDNIDLYQTPIIPIKLMDGLKGWWNKMQLFKPGMLPDGDYLYFDLDVVIVSNIDCFFDFANFGITRDFINPDDGIIGGKEYNSSVMKFTQSQPLWDFYNSNHEIWNEYEKKIPIFGDQNVISAFLNHHNYTTPFPDEWIWSYKIGELRGRRPIDHSQFFGSTIPQNGKICVFHGRPNPDEVPDTWVKENWLTNSAEANCKHQIQVIHKDTHDEITLNDKTFNAPKHWFWREFSDEWEPQTLKFFKKNLIKGTGFLDIGAWIGPTSMIATSLGAKNVKIIEPNPLNFLNLIGLQLQNNLLNDWFLVNACISEKAGSNVIGPISRIASSSSASHIRNNGDNGAKVISMKLADLIQDGDDFSLIKIDIEGSEESIIEDLLELACNNAAIWLSLHPPFYQNKHNFLNKLSCLTSDFLLVDENNEEKSFDEVYEQVMSAEEKPAWGTKWGNFFEIGLLPKKFFCVDGLVFSRSTEGSSHINETAA